MLRPAEDVIALKDLDCLACGPGLGQRHSAHHLLGRVLAHDAPLVLDADALNLVANSGELQEKLRNRSAPVLLTPHPAEAARLLGRSTAEVQVDRIAAAIELAARFRASVVLKGNGSVCAFADGDWFINTSGNPGMASAGVGDVLTGILAALIAQGAAPTVALLAGVHLHGAAGDRLAEQGIGPVGLIASELIDAARQLVNERPEDPA
jgi:ADP-dependent NAD(P)H-hydrate dehydratase / NAD(P)H-hydrate epimerase